jgi:hypothetical protein
MLFSHSFAGHSVETYDFNGDPVWIVADITKAIGYAAPTTLAAIRRNSGFDLKENLDFRLLAGSVYERFREENEGLSARGAGCSVLFESGVVRLCNMKSEQTALRSKEFLQYFRETILPDVYEALTSPIKKKPAPAPPAAAPAPSPPLTKSTAAAPKAEDAKKEKDQKVKALEAVIQRLRGKVPASVLADLELARASSEFGVDLSDVSKLIRRK